MEESTRNGQATLPGVEPSPSSRPLEPVPEPLPPDRLLNQELSWLAFNERVLDEARDGTLPVYERLKFLTIVSSNLDEFFMVRVARLKTQVARGARERTSDGLTPAETLDQVSLRIRALLNEQYRVLTRELLPELGSQGVQLVTPERFTAEQKAAARAYFTAHVFPALTPLAVDHRHPFPHLRNRSLNIAVRVYRAEKRRGRKTAPPKETLLAVVQVPAMLSRLVRLPSEQGMAFVLLEDLIAAHVGDLFPGYGVKQHEIASFRVLRNWDLSVDEEESEDLLSDMAEEVRKSDRSAAVRLTVSANAPDDLVGELAGALELDPLFTYRIDGPLQLTDLNALGDADGRPGMRATPHVPVTPPALRDCESVFDVVAQGDVLLHHPYESFDPVVRLVAEAAEDPQVVAIKQTLYRTSGDSPFVRALSRAAENGKQVTALVELEARFDEAANVAWARRLEQNGVHVVFGIAGLKTHCKVAVVVRREGAGIRRYVHLGTGNYNPNTARVYTDLSLLTCRQELADDAGALFNLLTGYADPPHWKKLAVAPFALQDRVLQLIRREAERARRGEPGRIVAKLNSLTDEGVISALYDASAAGVQVELVVRGICCLRPGDERFSRNIRVTSIVDRFLEHSRVFAFGTGERTEVFISSADWRRRNFQRRIEVLFPIEDKALKARLVDEVLGLALADDVKARRLLPDGRYVRVESTGAGVRSQVALAEAARKGTEPVLRPVVAA